MAIITGGHRGACGYEPENTLRSFRKALELGAGMVELDVHLCRSGEIVVLHDETLERTTNGSGTVKEKTLSELKTLDAGKGERIPTLDEVVDAVGGKAAINIELKGAGTAQAVADLVRRCVRERGRTYGDFLVSSFEHRWLRELKAALPGLALGVLSGGVSSGLLASAADMRAFSVHPAFRSVDRGFVEQAHAKGLKVFVWTVDAEDDIARMRSLGVDGIFSNYPDRVARLRGVAESP